MVRASDNGNDSDDQSSDDDNGGMRNEVSPVRGSSGERADKEVPSRGSSRESVRDRHSPFSGGDRGHSGRNTSGGQQHRRYRDSGPSRCDRQDGSPFRGRGDRDRRGGPLYDDRGRYGENSRQGEYDDHHRRRSHPFDSTEYVGDENSPPHSDDERRHGGNRQRRERPRQRDDEYENDDDDDDDEPPRKKAMSYRTAPRQQQKHVVERIAVLVKGPIFRKMKIVSSDRMLEKAIKIVVEAENPSDPEEFIRIYKTCIVGGINAKRSSCEQAGQRIVKKLLSRKGYTTDVDQDPPYSVETIVKLRQSETEHEKEAFRWFIGEFVASVAGNKLWGRNKYYHRVSEAVIDRGGRDLVVTPSDEAFAILIYENYIEKWIARFHLERRGEKAEGNMKGKYTSSVNNECMYGGWSAAGIARYNELSSLVIQDRQSEQARAAEDAVLLVLRREKFGDNVDDNVTDPREERQRVMPEPIEAYCELE